MIGRDFSQVGTDAGVYAKYGDGYGYPYKGAVTPMFLDSNLIAVLDGEKGIHVQRLGGISYYVCQNPTSVLAKVNVEEDEFAGDLVHSDSHSPNVEPVTKQLDENNEDEESDEDKSYQSVAEIPEEIKYVDINPVNFSLIPNSFNLAIADATNVVKVVHKEDWTIEKSIGGSGSGLGKFARISSISYFNIGTELFLCITELGNQRMQVLNEYGKHVVSVSGAGPMPGQFRDPVSVSTFIDLNYVSSGRAVTAAELLVQNKEIVSANTVKEKLPAVTNRRSSVDDRQSSIRNANLNSRQTMLSSSSGRPGSSSNNRPKSNSRPNTNNGPNSGQVKPNWYHGICLLRDLKNRIARKMEIGSYALGKRHDDNMIYDFIYVFKYPHAVDPVMEHVVFRINEDGRVINCNEEHAAVDNGGYDCIWSAIKKYNKVLRHGTDPRPCVMISVADCGNSRIQIFKYYYTVVMDLYVPSIEVSSIIGGIRKRVVELQEPTAVAYTPTGELVICDSGSRKLILLSKRLDLIRVLSIGFEMVNNTMFRSPNRTHSNSSSPSKTMQHSNIDHKICSVCVSSDYKIAVGFQCGGLLIYKPYKYYNLGGLENLTEKLFQYVLTYCNYKDIENLRNTCRYLHDFTRKLRSTWILTGMRSKSYDTMVYAYMKWCKNEIGVSDLLKQTPLVDEKNRNICIAHLELRCRDKYCVQSHALAMYDTKALSLSTLMLDLECVCSCISFVFSPCFLWQYEVYIQELFLFYAVSVKIIRRTVI